MIDIIATNPIISDPWPLNTPVDTKTNPKMYIEINVIVNDGGILHTTKC